MIPDEAVEAANEAVFRKFNGMMRPALVKVVLEAAAPHLMTAAWDEGLEVGLVSAVRIDSAPDTNPYRKAPDA